jgi:hypothetical protein
MKVSLRRTRKGITIRFSAQADPDGVNLKDAVIEAASNCFSPVAIIEALQARGYKTESVERNPTSLSLDARLGRSQR